MTKRTAVVIDRIMAALGAGILMANHYKVSKHLDKFVADYPRVILGVFVLAVLFQVIGPVEALTAMRRDSARKRLDDKILRSFGNVVKVARQAGLSYDEVSFHLWRVGHPVRACFRPRLVRVTTLRLSVGDMATVPSFQPPKGIGAVGQCWKQNNIYSYNRLSHTPMPTTKAEYNAAFAKDPDAFNNLTWSEFSQVSHVQAIFTAPIRARGKHFVGCVSVDAPRNFAGLQSKGMSTAVHNAASGLSLDDLRNLRS